MICYNKGKQCLVFCLLFTLTCAETFYFQYVQFNWHWCRWLSVVTGRYSLFSRNCNGLRAQIHKVCYILNTIHRTDNKFSIQINMTTTAWVLRLGLFPQFLPQAFMQNVSLTLFSKHCEDITFYQSLSHCSHCWQSAIWTALADSCQELRTITDTGRFYRTKNVHHWPPSRRGWYPNRDMIDLRLARFHTAILIIACYLNNEVWLELAADCAFKADRLTSFKGAAMLLH